jgi:hypothetical protein
LSELQRLTDWGDERVLYFGDHPYADLADLVTLIIDSVTRFAHWRNVNKWHFCEIIEVAKNLGNFFNVGKNVF